MTIIRGPWCNSIAVSDRLIIRQFENIWQAIAPLSDADAVALMQLIGLDARLLRNVHAAFEREIARRRRRCA